MDMKRFDKMFQTINTNTGQLNAKLDKLVQERNQVKRENAKLIKQVEDQNERIELLEREIRPERRSALPPVPVPRKKPSVEDDIAEASSDSKSSDDKHDHNKKWSEEDLSGSNITESFEDLSETDSSTTSVTSQTGPSNVSSDRSKSSEASTFKVDDFVVVNFEENLFPGRVTDVKPEGIDDVTNIQKLHDVASIKENRVQIPIHTFVCNEDDQVIDTKEIQTELFGTTKDVKELLQKIIRMKFIRQLVYLPSDECNSVGKDSMWYSIETAGTKDTKQNAIAKGNLHEDGKP
ncbi:hypothetical protein FQA39_LY13659 [Lamprigera yunnana]|nr:hypothetical protein FQA39_LY13659 [Lamprigera yunnana]